MTTAPALPTVLQDLVTLVRAGETAQAISEVRRVTHCKPKKAQELLSCLGDGVEAIRRFPDLVAQLVGDPQPRDLARFRAQRSILLRTLRRGNRLEVMRLLTADGHLSQSQARQFAQALLLQGEHWALLERIYANPTSDFWKVRPWPDPPEPPSYEILFAPDTFDPQLLLEWLARGQSRACVLWVRQASKAPRPDCQALVDRLDELVFDADPNPWDRVTQEWPEVIAGLACLPNPSWLRQLRPQRATLVELLENKRGRAAAQLVADTMACSSLEARRFLRRLGNAENWERTETDFVLGQVFARTAAVAIPRPAVVAPAVVAPAVVAPAVIAPAVIAPKVAAPEVKTELQGPAPSLGGGPGLGGPEPARVTSRPVMPWETSRAAETEGKEKARLAFESQRLQESQAEAAALAAVRAREGEATRSDTQMPSVVAAAAARPAFSLDDTDQLIDRLTRLGDAVARKDTFAAAKIYDELEKAGFNRGWVTARYPALLPWLPDDPWSQRLPQVGQFAQTLTRVIHGEITPAQLAQQALQASQLEPIVGALETAWKTKSQGDLQKAVGLLQQHPHLAEQVHQRFPWLAGMLDLDKDGTNDVVEVINDPAAYFTDLLQTKFPDLAQRLGESRVKEIKEILPELLQSMKERNMRGVMRVMSRLRLGPSDVKALLGALRVMVQH